MNPANSDANSISIPVSTDAVASFMAMPEARRDVLRRLLGMRLEQAVKSTDKEFSDLMDEAGREAKKNGLTPEILQKILDEG